MFCPKCGCDNADTVVCCIQCGAKIPHFIQEAKPVDTPAPINGRLRLIEDAVGHVQDGTWELDKFLEFLQGVYEVLSEKEREIREIAIPEEYGCEFQRELDVGFSGIALYNEGIELMLEFDGVDMSVLDEGLGLVRKGNERINEAMRINRASRGELEEEIARENTGTL